MKGRFALFTAVYVLSFGLYAQEPFYLSSFLYAPWSRPSWEVSYSLPRKDPQFLDAVAIPFRFPMETLLAYSYSGRGSLQMGRLGSADDVRFQHLQDFFSHTGISGYIFLYRKKNFGLNLDLSFLMTNTLTGISRFEGIESKARFSYRIFPRFPVLSDSDAKLELFFELSEFQALLPREGLAYDLKNLPLFRSSENTNRPGIAVKQIYASPGISFSSSSTFVFEGQIRVPMNSREANRTLDELWTPEIQTHLGMKYIIPVTGIK